jgi:prepilin-type N-terminal cleavage/methylation domain-containing protein
VSIVRQRSGFTLIELMLSMAMMLMVGGAVYQLLVTTQRLARTQAEQLSLQSSVRNGALVIANELRELSTAEGEGRDQNDILSIAASGMVYRAMRGTGVVCQPPTATQIRIGRNGFSGYRDPQPGRDSAYVFLGGSAETYEDDAWLPVAITSVSSVTPCPGSGGPGFTLTIPANSLLVGIPAGTPVRVYEIMEVKLYRSEERSWLGARSVSSGEAIQPVLGPLTDGDGLRLEYFAAAGVPTNDVTAIKSIGVTIRGITENRLSSGGLQGRHAEEELTTQVALRNAFH